MAVAPASSSINVTVNRAEFDALVAMVKTQQQKQDALERENAELKRQVGWFRRQLFGPKSEKREIENPHQMHLGEEFLAPADAADTRPTKQISFERGIGPRIRPEDCVTDTGLRFDSSVPQITDLNVPTVERLLTLDKIVFYKEGSSQTGKVIELLTKSYDACIFADDVTDPDTPVGAWAMGADGIFNISANIIPQALARLATPWESIEDVASFRALICDVLPMIRYCYEGHAPINLKHAMNAAGLGPGGVRPPLNLHDETVPGAILDAIRHNQPMTDWTARG